LLRSQKTDTESYNYKLLDVPHWDTTLRV